MVYRFVRRSSLSALVLSAMICAITFPRTTDAETLGTNQVFQIPGAVEVFAISDDGRTVLCHNGEYAGGGGLGVHGLFIWKNLGDLGWTTIPFPSLDGRTPSDLRVVNAFLPGKNPDLVIVSTDFEVLRWDVPGESAASLLPDSFVALTASCVSETGNRIYGYSGNLAMRVSGATASYVGDYENVPGRFRLDVCSPDGLTAFGGWGNLVDDTSCFLYSPGGGAEHRLSANPEVHWLHFDAASGDGYGVTEQFAVGCRDRWVADTPGQVDYTSTILIAEYAEGSLGLEEVPAPANRIVQFADACKAELAVGSTYNPNTNEYRAFRMDLSGAITYLSGDSTISDAALAITEDGKEIYGEHYGNLEVSSLGPFQWSQARGYLPLRQAIWCDPYLHFGLVSRNGDWVVLTGGYQSFYVAETRNRPPKVDPIAPIAVECVDGSNRVTLSTPYSDPDFDSLDIQWFVNGQVAKTVAGESSGTTTFVHDFPHGDYAVYVTVSDGFLTEAVYTTVTVHDTTAPTVFAAQDVVVPTDPGRSYASGVILPPPVVTDNCDWEWTLVNDAPSVFPLGQTIVNWTATDGSGNVAGTTQRVIVEDREKPKIVTLPTIRKYCDPGKLSATVALAKPKATDNVPKPVSVTTKAKSPFQIGTTNVVWTAKDAAGNVSTWTQKVVVTNRRPTARAGKDIVIVTSSAKGTRVNLNGSASTDPDKHKLKFKWSVPGVKLTGPTTAKAYGVFPVGTKTATLSVTDVGGLKHTDTVKVTVRLRNARPRALGGAANRSFAAAVGQVGQSGAAPTTFSSASMLGRTYAAVAAGLGDAAGDHVQWEEGGSPKEAALAYSELRALQRTYGSAAVHSLLSAFAETGDEALLSAARHAADGTAYAEADLAE